jgi:ABC-2 type transport system ATP-binding protein
MKAVEAIAFMGALRGLSLPEGRKRGPELLERHGLGHAADRRSASCPRAWRRPCNCSARWCTPRLVVLDEPFSGLDAINQGKLEVMIRAWPTWA